MNDLMTGLNAEISIAVIKSDTAATPVGMRVRARAE